MREIEFMGRRVDGQWLYGDLLRNRGETFIAPDGIQSPLATADDFKVDPETVGQYTGLKDKNGVKIFEGDIVSIQRTIDGNFVDTIYEKKRICWFRSEFVFQPMDRDLSYPDLIRLNENETMEVIGNIHDNPEFFKDAGNA